MQTITTIGLNIAKSVFQVHGVDAGGSRTWLHRPMRQNVKKALADPEPSTHGTFETCQVMG